MTDLTPLGDRVLLKALDRADMAERIGSIWLPRSYTDDAQSYMAGEVVSVGPLVTEVVAGMRVIHRQFRDLPLLDLRAISIEDILGVITIEDDGAWKFAPIGTRVTVKPYEPNSRERGIIRLDPWRKPSLRGHIVALGPDTSELKLGTEVIYPPSIGSALELAGEEFLIYKEDEILATIGEQNE